MKDKHLYEFDGFVLDLEEQTLSQIGKPISIKVQSESLSLSEGSTQAAISPDGKYVAYLYEKTGQQSLWIKTPETGNNVRIITP